MTNIGITRLPLEDQGIIRGRGTWNADTAQGLELMDQLPEVGTVVIPTGGGGLLAGSSYAIHSVKPNVGVIW